MQARNLEASATPPAPPSPRRTHPPPQTAFSPRDRLALLAVCLAALMSGLEISSVPVILPLLENTLQGSFQGMQWIMNGYTIACAAVLMATGTLADRYGRKRVFLYAIALFGASSLLCGLAWSTPLLIGARVLQGASGGAMLICLVAVLSRQFSQPGLRAKAFSAWGIVFGIGLGFGPLIGGVIVALSSWRWVFWVHVFVAVLTWILAMNSVRESRNPDAGRLDVAGTVTLSLAVLGLAYFVTQGADAGFGDASALAALAASLVSFCAFLAAERRAAHPMFHFPVFRIRNFSGALLGSAGMNFSFWPMVIYLPIYFQGALGLDAATAGAWLLAYTLPTLVLPPLGERLALRYRPGIVIPGGLFVIGLGFLLMRIGSTTPWLTVLPGCLVAGAGLGLTNTPVTNTSTGSVSSARAGMASGIDMSARMISLAVNIATMGFLLVAGVARHLRTALPAQLAGDAIRALASRIAAGDLRNPTAATTTGLPPETLEALARAALTHGFGWIMLYGALAVWTLAFASYLTMRRATTASAS
ncbi:MFS transporter [Bordetella genomosp. 10]|uniref:MFS transporter n=1 Tax=Bordetella genomosp. 10 TaxID=1416804 RepID=A0A261SJ55_9BORD|nr:MFS transporter [Bordetella genomosp. 10]OZI37468.1 MFS transporter [Bordetella genomosp. 10]